MKPPPLPSGYYKSHKITYPAQTRKRSIIVY